MESAMLNGLKREAGRMRMKGASSMQQPRPENSTAGKCYVCGDWSEELKKDARCHTEECDTLLELLAKDHSSGRQYVHVTEGAHSFKLIKTELVRLERKNELLRVEREAAQLNEHSAFDPKSEQRVNKAPRDERDDMCSCGKDFKLPRYEQCRSCYRLKVTARKRSPTRGYTQKMNNGIKGLGGIKL